MLLIAASAPLIALLYDEERLDPAHARDRADPPHQRPHDAHAGARAARPAGSGRSRASTSCRCSSGSASASPPPLLGWGVWSLVVMSGSRPGVPARRALGGVPSALRTSAHLTRGAPARHDRRQHLRRPAAELRDEEPRQRRDRPAARAGGARPVLAGVRALPPADAAAERHARPGRAARAEQAAGRPRALSAVHPRGAHDHRLPHHPGVRGRGRRLVAAHRDPARTRAGRRRRRSSASSRSPASRSRSAASSDGSTSRSAGRIASSSSSWSRVRCSSPATSSASGGPASEGLALVFGLLSLALLVPELYYATVGTFVRVRRHPGADPPAADPGAALLRRARRGAGRHRRAARDRAADPRRRGRCASRSSRASRSPRTDATSRRSSGS